jgi:hypothetical protein
MADDDDIEEIRRRVGREVEALTTSQLRTFQRSRTAMENWMFRTARAIARFISAPFRWIMSAIEGFFDGLFGR